MATAAVGTDRPDSPLDREAIARVEVGHTDVSPGLARLMVGWFLVMLAVLPLTEFVAQRGGLRGAAFGSGEPRAAQSEEAPPLREPQRAGGAGPPIQGTRPSVSAWSHLAALPDAIARRLATAADETRGPRAWHVTIAANRAVLEGLSAFESALEDQSAVGRALRPPTQLALSGWFGAGNERVYVGREGWLFYRPDVEHLTGRGFLDRGEMERRVAAASEYEAPPQPDPRPAIRQFKRDLEARGITLVVVPTPVKPSIHPGELARRPLTPTRAVRDVPHNPSYDAFIEEMRRDGVLVFDPAGAMDRGRAAGTPQYLATDTHWRPETMQLAAEALAVFLQEHVPLPPAASARYGAERREARQTGDTAAMLDLPLDQTLYPPERVALRYVVDAAGAAWRPSREADVLLLGDSFTNMFSLATMGWGEAAGFAEQLSYALQRPVDRVVQNDDGAHATRELLRRELGGEADRLAGKRVVVWQFATRELSFGDWKVLALR